MFKGNNQKLKFKVEEGLSIIAHGNVSVYSPRGTYQINCLSLEPSGSGALAFAYEQLKKKLEDKGYFDKSIKKHLPMFPKTIAVVTSKTGAALQDMLRVAKKRWPLVKIILNVKTPTVSAVGHEIDFLISDFVADLRAPTPSAAFEMILPDKNEMLMYMDSLQESLNNTFKRIIVSRNEELKNIFFSYKQNSLQSKILLYEKEINTFIERFHGAFSFLLHKKDYLRIYLIKKVK